MRKTIIAASVSGLLLSTSAVAATIDDLKISGFGTIAVGASNQDFGYHGYDKDATFNDATLMGLQFDFQANERLSVTTQLVAKARYNYQADVEMAYASYAADGFTVRGGKLRAPIFNYSEYVDVGYSFPMVRPSNEVYGGLMVSTFTGMDLLVPFELGNTTLVLQPYAGETYVREEETPLGKVKLEEMMGVSLTWSVGDWLFRGSYTQADLAPTVMTQDNSLYQLLVDSMDGAQTTFASLSAQYNNGVWFVNAEAMEHKVDGVFWDVAAASLLIGRTFGSVMPYASVSYIETTDDKERQAWGYPNNSYERTAYSLGARWDFLPKVALKGEVTWADFGDTYGGLDVNAFGSSLESDVLVYSLALDFVF
ncbi:MAG: hypothetical protein R3Y10_00885 [Ferrimonas sp.]